MAKKPGKKHRALKIGDKVVAKRDKSSNTFTRPMSEVMDEQVKSELLDNIQTSVKTGDIGVIKSIYNIGINKYYIVEFSENRLMDHLESDIRRLKEK